MKLLDTGGARITYLPYHPDGPFVVRIGEGTVRSAPSLCTAVRKVIEFREHWEESEMLTDIEERLRVMGAGRYPLDNEANELYQHLPVAYRTLSCYGAALGDESAP